MQVDGGLSQAGNGRVEFQEFFDASPYPASFLGRDLVYQAVNAAYERYHGCKREDLIGLSPADLHAPDAFAAIKARLDRCLAGEDVVYDMWFDYPRMGRRCMSVGYHPRRNARGEVVGVLHISRDITEHVEADRRVAEERDRLDTVLTALDTGLTLLNRDMTVAWANQKIRRLFPGQDPVGSPCHRFFAQSETPCPGCPALKTFASGQVEHDERYLPAQGKWFSHIAQPVRDADGRIVQVLESVTDITARKRSEAALAQSENKWRHLLAKAPQIGIALDPRGRLIFANDHFLELTGWRREEVLGADWFETFVPDDLRDELRGMFRAAMERGRGFGNRAHENDILHRDGTRLTVAWSNVLSLDAEGRPVDVTCLGTDVTQRRRAEAAVRESENTLRSIFRAAPVGAGLVTNRIITRANERLCAMTGYSAGELVGRSARMVYPDDAEYEFVGREKYRQISERGTGTVETRWRRKDGTVIDVILSSTPLDRDDWGKGVTFTALDISERKRTEEALKASERHFRDLLNDVDMVAMQGYDQDRRVIYWNTASERLYGYTEAEALGRCLEDLIIPAPMRDAVVQGVRDWVERGTPIPPGELELSRKDGTPVPVYSSHVMQTTASGQKAMYCIDVELTEIKKAHDLLLRAKEQAEAANRAKSAFLANMSHEIRTPLNGILGMLQLLQMTSVDAEQTEYILTAVQSSRRLTRLLSDILDLSRVEAGKMDITPADFDFTEVMRAVTQLFNASAQKKKLALRVRIDPGIPAMLRGDAVRLQQVLGNLIGNAIKFTSAGSVEVDAHLLPASRQDQCRILFSVTDTGIGIPDEMLGRLFTPFTQASQGYKREHQGAGLGLSICKRLVELMGGQIAVESEPGTGTAIHCSLAFEVAASSGEAASEGRTGTGRTEPLAILFVEDDQVSRLYTVRLAEKLGHRVATADDGRQALAALRDGAFDIVLMDVQMPVMDGLEAARRIRAGEAGPGNAGIPIIALTAYAMSGDKETFLAAGMDGYLPKPVELEALVAVLGSARDARRTRGGGSS
jgi:PAS domain S-box-containing protein